MVKVSLTLPEISSDFDHLVAKLYNSIEANIMEVSELVDFKSACLFARSFGLDFGSKEFFAMLSLKTESEI